MYSELCEIDMSDRRFADLTTEVRKYASDKGSGLLSVFVPHATAGLAVMEFGSGSEVDLEDLLGRMLPRDHAYVHSHGAMGHGADHVIPAFLSPSVVIPVLEGEVMLGTWQSVVLVDLNRDNPQRKYRLSFVTGT